jgi:hypothetical protein
MSDYDEEQDGERGDSDPQLEFLQALIKENEFLQRENLLLEAYLAKIDFAKAGIDIDEELGIKVCGCCAWRMAWGACTCMACQPKRSAQPCTSHACKHAFSLRVRA